MQPDRRPDTSETVNSHAVARIIDRLIATGTRRSADALDDLSLADFLEHANGSLIDLGFDDAARRYQLELAGCRWLEACWAREALIGRWGA